ncbi:MAG: HAD-IB family phosphatase [Chloroflexi bacterium]|nr:HAD-IB family phosphatase [Chloroflexota bacterium]
MGNLSISNLHLIPMRWPPYKHVFFDCDSTLTTVEGIDILAETVGKKWRVGVLTNAAMDGKRDLEDVYAKRLQAIRPTHAQIQEIRRVYKRNIVEDAKETIAALQYLGHHVYIISGGLAEPVEEFGLYLGVPREHIRAVNVAYDRLSGRWWEKSEAAHKYLDYEEGALTVSNGKAQIVKTLLGKQNGRALLIGDGRSDLLAGTAVDLFIGFGGVVERSHVRKNAPVFLHSHSLAPLLALAAGPAVGSRLQNNLHQEAFNKGNHLIQTGALTFNNEQLKTKFERAVTAAHQTVHPRPNESTT